jgi:hypothetical protein
MAGYSGTPLPKKLGIKAQARVFLLDVPADVAAVLKQCMSSCQLSNDGRGPLDFVIIFVKSTGELQKKFDKVAKQLAPAGMLWISWPKKASGLQTDLNENDVRRIGLEHGLVDVKVCAVNEVWSGLKFVIPVKDRIKK